MNWRDLAPVVPEERVGFAPFSAHKWGYGKGIVRSDVSIEIWTTRKSTLLNLLDVLEGYDEGLLIPGLYYGAPNQYEFVLVQIARRE